MWSGIGIAEKVKDAVAYTNVYAEDIQRHNIYKLNVYAEDIQRRKHLSWMFMPKIFNVINIYKLNVYAEDIQRHKHLSWMFMPKIFNVINI